MLEMTLAVVAFVAACVLLFIVCTTPPEKLP